MRSRLLKRFERARRRGASQRPLVIIDHPLFFSALALPDEHETLGLQGEKLPTLSFFAYLGQMTSSPGGGEAAILPVLPAALVRQVASIQHIAAGISACSSPSSRYGRKSRKS